MTALGPKGMHTMRQTHLKTFDINCNPRRHIEDRICAIACV